MIEDSRELKKILLILGGLVTLIIACILIMCEMDKNEMKKAYSEGRYEKCYTRDGDVYYR